MKKWHATIVTGLLLVGQSMATHGAGPPPSAAPLEAADFPYEKLKHVPVQGGAHTDAWAQPAVIAQIFDFFDAHGK